MPPVVNNRETVPAEHAVAITPNDSTTFSYVTRGLWIGGAGTVKVDMYGGESGVTFSGVPAGTLLPIAVTRVYSAGTSATLIVGVY